MALPAGTVTLLFSDVEGSTQLQRRLGPLYQEVVREHRRLLEETFAAHRGHVVDRQTESFFVAFTRARDAVAAAADAQRALARHPWPDGVQVKVRMGVHAGEPEVDGDHYVGLDVSRAARICAAGHGGQVVVSSAARSLLGDDERAALRELGSYRLKDFPAPEPLSQLAVDALPGRFPPLRAERTRSRRRLAGLAAGTVLLGGAAVVAAILLTTGESSGPSAVGPTSLGVVDATSNEIVDEIPLGFKSRLIAAGRDYVWIADPRGSVLRRIDVRTRAVEPIGLQTGGLPNAIAVGAGAVWVTALRGDDLILIELDPELGDIRGEPLVLTRDVPTGLLTSPALAVGLGAVWILDPASAALRRLDHGTRRPRTVTTDVGDSFALAVGPDWVWVAGSNTVRRIDPATGTAVPPILVGQPGAFTDAAAIAVGRDAAYFVASSQTALWRIDARTNIASSVAAVGQGSAGVALGEGSVWVPNSRDGTIVRFDPASGQTTRIELGTGRGGAAVAHGLVWVAPGEPLA